LVEAAQSAGFEDVTEAVVRLQVTDGDGP
jgi:hypothetical protein